MADRYVVPAGGTWDAAGTAAWSATDGGASGASAPGAADNVFLTALSGNLVLSINGLSCANFDCTGYTGTLSGSATRTFTGDTFKLVPGMTYTATNTFTFTGANAVGDITLTRAGKTTNNGYTFDGSGKNFKFADAHNLGSGSITVTTGNLDYQGFAVTCASTTLTAGSIDADGCTVTLTGAITVTSGDYSQLNGTLTSTSTATVIGSANTNTRSISLTGTDVLIAGMINIAGAGLTWSPPDLVRYTRGATSPATAILLANTGNAFPLIEISQAGTGAFSGFQLSGAADIGELAFVGVANANWLGAKITLASDITIDKMSLPAGSELVSSVNGTARTVTTGTNEISFDECMIRDITIVGGPAYATGSIDLGNNTGITFNNFGPNTHEITSVTLDDNKDPLGSCLVVAFKADGGVLKEVSRTTSDAVTGAYTLPTPDNDANAYTVLGTKTGAYRGDSMNGITPTVP